MCFCSKERTYGPTLCLVIDTHIRSKVYKVIYFWVFLTKDGRKSDEILLGGTPLGVPLWLTSNWVYCTLECICVSIDRHNVGPWIYCLLDRKWALFPQNNVHYLLSCAFKLLTIDSLNALMNNTNGKHFRADSLTEFLQGLHQLVTEVVDHTC